MFFFEWPQVIIIDNGKNDLNIVDNSSVKFVKFGILFQRKKANREFEFCKYTAQSCRRFLILRLIWKQNIYLFWSRDVL